MLNNKITSIIIGLVFVIVIGGIVFLQKNSTSVIPTDELVSSNPDSTVPSNSEIPDIGSDITLTVTPEGGITLAEVATHNSRNSCWSMINGKVYDLTSWIPNHPGGEEAILSLCGVDGSAGFNGQHGTAKKPLFVLSGFMIGAQ